MNYTQLRVMICDQVRDTEKMCVRRGVLCSEPLPAPVVSFSVFVFSAGCACRIEPRVQKDLPLALCSLQLCRLVDDTSSYCTTPLGVHPPVPFCLILKIHFCQFLVCEELATRNGHNP